MPAKETELVAVEAPTQHKTIDAHPKNTIVTTMSFTDQAADVVGHHHDFFYQDGDTIETKWNIAFIFLAYLTSFIGSYSAIRLLEHGLWRSKREQANASSCE